MTKPLAMFWSGETLSDRLKPLIEPFTQGRVDCAAYTWECPTGGTCPACPASE